ncbi:MAG: hypothetical protein ACREDR_35030 [Blastocatellia bacterium]
MTTLYIFATSKRPDVYINTIAHTIEHLNDGDQLRGTYIIVVSEHGYPGEQDANLAATTVQSNISEQLEQLSTGSYVAKWHDSEPAENRERTNIEPLANPSKTTVYKKCLDAMNRGGVTAKGIPLSELDQTLMGYASKGDCIIDVSALKKNLLVDVVATLLSVGFHDVYSFELVREAFGQEALYHNLRNGEDYVFRNLTKSKSVAGSLRRMRRWSVTRQVIMLVTLVVALALVALAAFLPGTPALTVASFVAMASSIGSFISLFLPRKLG